MVPSLRDIELNIVFVIISSINPRNKYDYAGKFAVSL